MWWTLATLPQGPTNYLATATNQPIHWAPAIQPAILPGSHPYSPLYAQETGYIARNWPEIPLNWPKKREKHRKTAKIPLF